MQEIDSKTDKLYEYVAKLPVACEPFLLETGTELSLNTRVAYAFELYSFFQWLTYNSPTFCDMDPKDMLRDDLSRITSQDISRYLTVAINKNKAKRTVARKRAALSSFFSYLTDNRILEFNPVSAATHVKVPQKDEVLHLNAEEQISLLEAVDRGDKLSEREQAYHDRYKLRDYTLILLLLDTGMRVSELQQIDIGNISFKDHSVIVVRKGGDTQTLFFSDEASEALYELAKAHKKRGMTADNVPLFQTAQGTRLGVRAIEKLVKKYTASAIPGKGELLSPHKMRSSFAMGYYREEKDILALQRKLGHKSLAATNIYAKATKEEMQQTRSVMEQVRNKARKEDV